APRRSAGVARGPRRFASTWGFIQPGRGRSNMKRLEDKVAIVTGATSGIGRSCAVRFAQEGAHVVVAGRRRGAGEAVAPARGGRCGLFQGDVSAEEDIRALVETPLRRFGRIDCVVNNAGSGSSTGAIADPDPRAFDQAQRGPVRA